MFRKEPLSHNFLLPVLIQRHIILDWTVLELADSHTTLDLSKEKSHPSPLHWIHSARSNLVF